MEDIQIYTCVKPKSHNGSRTGNSPEDDDITMMKGV
uniref:Uncharacterized protein n=1 Tax=Heterorhabditis bacteriophora TaxID=37862 RepID=A0A1I7WZH6_HETBA